MGLRCLINLGGSGGPPNNSNFITDVQQETTGTYDVAPATNHPGSPLGPFFDTLLAATPWKPIKPNKARRSPLLWDSCFDRGKHYKQSLPLGDVGAVGAQVPRDLRVSRLLESVVLIRAH